MDEQNLVCWQPVSFHNDLQRAHRRNNCSRKSLKSYQADVQQCQEISSSLTKEGSTALAFSGSIEEIHAASNNGLSSLINDKCDAYSSAYPYTNRSDANKLAKKGSRKKVRRKANWNKKFSSLYGVLTEKGHDHYSEDENFGSDHISDTNTAGNAATLFVVDITENFDDSNINKHCTSCTSYPHELKEKRTESISQDFTAENLTRDQLVDGRSSELRSTSSMNQTVLSSSDEVLTRANHSISYRYNIFSGNIIRDALSDECKCNNDGSTNFRSGFENMSSNTEDSNLFLDGSIGSCDISGSISAKGFHCYGNSRDSNKYKTRVCSTLGEGESDKQGCSSSNTQISLSSKRINHIRKLTGTSSCAHRQEGVFHVSGRNGSKNPSAVWQRVQKDDKDEFVYEPKRTHPVNLEEMSPLSIRYDMSTSLKSDASDNTSMPATSDEFTPQNDSAELVSGHGDSCASLPRSQDEASKNKAITKYVGKIFLHSKQSKNHNYRMKRHDRKIKSQSAAVMGIIQKKVVTVDKKIFPIADSTQYCRPLETLPSHLEETRSLEKTCSISTGVPHSLLPDLSATTVSCDRISHSKFFMPDSCSGDSLFLTADELVENTKLESEVQHPDCENQDQKFGCLLQKWVPVGRKTVEMFCTSRNCSTTSFPERSLAARSLEDMNGRKLGSLNKQERAPDGNNFGPVNGSFIKADEAVIKLSLDASKSGTYHNVASGETDTMFTSLTGAEKIVQAVNDSYRLRLQSEVVQLATGRPLAEFERFLDAASPILCQAYSRLSCYSCSANKVIGDSLCRHQIPNLSLGNLWQWYERPGSCGLEIKVEDFQPKRLGPDRFTFHAYFVPFLSAVQLFGHPKSCTADIEDVKSCFGDKSSKDTASSFLPMLAMLLPQPLKDEDVGMHRHLDGFPGSDPLNAFSVVPQLGDLELLFEYFETEQPQLRRPLFEKIQELVRNESTSNSQMFGDPLKLEHLNLHDMHPLSWYSVAWYPIYRIPDGNLRAAFLTYHSLGHFIYRSASLDLLSMDPCIASPVIGLQSYNAQGECWFQHRNSGTMHNAGCSSLRPSEILKERLRTLEESACVLATASVCKEDQKYENRQPDYEFFLSRRR